MLTVLSFGAGQDSAAIWNKYRYDKEFRAKYAPEDFLCIFSDTGAEHPETYRYLVEVKLISMSEGIDFIAITPDMGYHGTGWQSLDDQYDTHQNVGSKAFRKACTDRLKLQPIYKFLSQWVANRYELPELQKKYRGKGPLVAYAERYGRIQMMLGIAHGEQKRVAKEIHLPKWQEASVDRVYPLLDLEMDRSACQQYVRDVGETVPWPSCCLKCPFMNLQELLWLSMDFPDVYADLVRQEANKMRKHADKGNKNYGVWGNTKTLPEILEKAKEKHGHLSLDELRDYRFSHGHCSTNSY